MALSEQQAINLQSPPSVTPPKVSTFFNGELVSKLVSAGSAASIAELITLPMDCAKIKLQVEGGTVFSTLRSIAVNDGYKGFFRGWVPGIHRQLGFRTIRLGLYGSAKDFYKQKTPLNEGLPLRFAAGISTAIAAVCVAQPTEVVKIRMQAAKAGTTRYSGTLSAYYNVAVTEGPRGLWSGLGPSIVRLSICNIGEVVTYDTVKSAMLAREIMRDALPLHCFSAICAGMVTTVMTSPVDVVKTTLIKSQPGEFSGSLACAVSVGKQHGLAGFYKGAVPSCIRISGWNLIMFITYEQIKKRISQHFNSY